jgi:hypothetical protein
LVMLTNQFATQYPISAALSLTIIGLFGLIFLPIFALLQVLVLDRLALLAGPTVIWGKTKRPAPEPTPGSSF